VAEEKADGGGFGGLPPDLLAQEDAIRWLRDKWGDYKPCPYCGGTEWGVAPAVPVLPEQGELVYPVTCQRCGSTTFLSAAFPGGYAF